MEDPDYEKYLTKLENVQMNALEEYENLLFKI